MIAWETVAATVVAMTAMLCGALIVRSRVAPTAGWPLLAAGIVGALGSLTGGRALIIVAWMVMLPAALWAYPTPRWRHPIDIVLGTLLIGPGVVASLHTDDENVVISLAVVAFLALVAQTAWRLERSEGAERRALAWTAVTVGVAALVSLTLSFSSESLIAVSRVVLVVIPVSMAVGLLRPGALDVRGLAVEAGVGLALAFGYVAYFAATLALLEILGAGPVSPIGLAMVGLFGGLLLHPAAKGLRDVMDQLLFGERPDPLDAATQVVGTISSDPEQALESLRSAMSLPYAALRRGDEVIAQSGEPVPHVRGIPSAQIDLVVGLRPGDLRLSSGDTHVLQLVAPLLAQLVRATELSAAVQQSRTQALSTMADERRRLRNELHDEIGPTLTGVAFTADATRNLLADDPAAAGDLLAAMRTDIGNAIQQVRGLVYGMRPPALDELGLVRAVEQQARGLGVDVDFEVVGQMSSLPAAVEVAAYRIAVESLTNVARHSQCGHARAVFDVSQLDVLRIMVTDAGSGEAPWEPGVGLASIRERVTELGGTYRAGPGPDGGLVQAELPLDR